MFADILVVAVVGIIIGAQAVVCFRLWREMRSAQRNRLLTEQELQSAREQMLPMERA